MDGAVSPISPELALVCPQLRRQWLTALPDIDPDALFRVARPRQLARASVAAAEPPVPFLLAAAVYTGTSIAASVVRGAVTLVVVAVVTLLLTLAG
ncbi:MAG: hypothetical protein H0V45_13885 [Actinobacteria bacterium]|nr:hypothetical protein [Actinomycetota bacterium]